MSRYCSFAPAGYDMKSGAQISSSVGGLIACTLRQKCPAPLPRSRYHRPPGHASSFIGIRPTPGASFSGPLCSSMVSTTTSIGAAIAASFKISSACSVCSVIVAAMLPPDSIPLLLLGPLLDAPELMGPVTFIGLHPIVHGLQLLRVEPVQPLLTTFCDGHNADLAQHAEMLRYRRLRDLHLPTHIADPPLPAAVQDADDLSPPRLRDCVEDIGGRRDSCHTVLYIPISPYICQGR